MKAASVTALVIVTALCCRSVSGGPQTERLQFEPVDAPSDPGWADAAFSADSTLLATARGRQVAVWEVGDSVRPRFSQEVSLPFYSYIRSIAFSRDGKVLAVGADKPVLLDAETGKTIAVFRGGMRGLNEVAISPDGTLLASCSTSKPFRAKTTTTEVRLWNIGDKTSRVVDSAESWTFLSVAFSPDGQTLAVGRCLEVWRYQDRTGSVLLYDVATGKQKGVLAGHVPGPQNYAHVVFSPDGKVLASGSIDHRIRLFDTETHKEIGGLDTSPFRVMGDITFTNDGKRIAAGLGLWDGPTRSTGEVRVWDTASESIVGRIPLPAAPPGAARGPANAAAMAPDGKWLAASFEWRGGRLYRVLDEPHR